MQQFLLCSILFCLAFSDSNAQYRGYPTFDQLGNPGATMYEDQYPGQGSIQGPAYGVIARWSDVMNIGFPFYFNGTLVNAFKVSTTGVLTFDTSVVSVPPAMHTLLPNNQIPDNSICICGINSTCINSYGSFLIFATQTTRDRANPLKQYWISFHNYSDTITFSQYPTTRWSIVLEEGTNNIYFVDHQTYWMTPQVTLGIQIDNSTAYMMPGSPTIASHLPVSGYSLENFYYTFEPISPVNIDGTIRATNFHGYLDINDAPYNLKADFRNLGYDAIHSLQLNYSVNGGTPVSENFSGLNIPCGQSQWFNFTTSVSVPDTGVYQLDVWTDQLNGTSDQYNANDHINQYLYVAPDLPSRRIMFEEFKGTWCLWAGYWTHKYDSIIEVNANKASSIKYETGWPFNLLGNQSLWPRQSLMGYYAVPTAYANGNALIERASDLFMGCPWLATQNLIDSLYQLPGLFDIQPHLLINGFQMELSAGITSKVQFPAGTFGNIMVALYQDTILTSPQGSSGESLFVNTTRRFFPDANGSYIGAAAFGQYDSLHYTYLLADPNIDLSRLHAVVFIQDTITREIFQCAEVKAVQICAPSINTVTHQICPGDSVLIYGNWITQNSTIDTLLTGSNGCDSLQIDIVNGAGLSVNIQAGGGRLSASGWSYNPGDVITWSWIDSVTQQIIPGATNYWFTPATPGTYALIMTNQDSCSVTSNYATWCSSVTTNLTTSICEGDTLFVGTRILYYSTNITVSLPQADGCGDSLIVVSLTVNDVDNNISFINGILSVPAGSISYQWIDCSDGLPITGQTSNIFVPDTINGGSYQCIVTNGSNCTELSSCYTIYPYNPQSVQSTVNICAGDSLPFGSQYISVPGNYNDTLINSFGLDSIADITLTNNYPDVSVTTTVDSLFSLATNSTYQWMDCLSANILPGETAAAFYPSASGNYAVIVADGYCADTSTCITYIWDLTSDLAEQIWHIFPNPANETVMIRSNVNAVFNLSLLDINGRQIKTFSFYSETRVDISDLISGSYILRISNRDVVWNKILIRY
jgi:hypothetical protein